VIGVRERGRVYLGKDSGSNLYLRRKPSSKKESSQISSHVMKKRTEPMEEK
jgi:hypothetical protein